MATQIAPIADTSGGGLKTISDLYDFINGQSRTTSGGTQTAVESSGVDKSTMDALMKTALESVNGLAAVAGGQRAAGGYNSSTNQLLISDLLTRTAAQIAAANKTTTRTVTTAPQTVKQGGISAGGVGKTAAFLGAVQSLDKLGVGSIFRKIMGDKTESGGAASSPAPMTEASVNDLRENLTAYNNPAYQGPLSSPSQNSPQFDFSNIPDYLGGGEASSFNQSSDTGSNIDTTPVYEQPDFSNLPDIGSTPYLPPQNQYEEFNFADGGVVDVTGARKKSLLGATQTNALVETPEGGTTAGANSYVAPTVAPQVASVNPAFIQPIYESPQSPDTGPGQVSAPPSGGQTSDQVAAIANDLSAQNGTDPLDELMGVTNAFGTGTDSGPSGGELSGPTAGQLATGLGVLGNLTGESGLSQMGQVIGIANSSNPALSGLVAAGSQLTGVNLGGLLGIAQSNEGTITGNIADFLTSLNPVTGVANALTSLATGSSIGDYVNTASNIASSPQSTALAGIANDVASTQSNQDSLDALMGITNSFGTAPATPNSAPVSDAVAPVSNIDTAAVGTAAAPAVAVDNSVAPSSPDLGSAPDLGDTSGGYGDTGGYSKGGPIAGPGTPTSDSITANVSDGEYILPAEVTKRIGVEKLNELVYRITGQAPKGMSAPTRGRM